MKNNLITTTIISLIFLLPNSFLLEKSLAQPNCYMEDANGNPLDLSDICGGNSPNFNSPSARSFYVNIKRKQSGIPVVDVIINNQYSYEMLVDTGASSTALTVKMAKDLNLTPENYVVVSTPSSSQTVMPTTIIKSLRVGKGQINNIEVIVVSSMSIGLLGQDFLSRYDVIIETNRIKFKRR